MISARVVRRPATTFKVRRRGLSPARRRDLETWLDRYGIDRDGPVLEWSDVFGRDAHDPPDVVLDVGFGHGEATIESARREPHLAIVGVEVHTPGVATVLDAVVHDPLPHVRVVHGDLLPFLDRVAAETLAGVRVFFPDPWPKARQQHRRLIRADVVDALVDRLRPGGFLHLATDIDDYAEQMAAVCEQDGRLAGGPIPRPASRPLTRFEIRGCDAGRTATDLRYERAQRTSIVPGATRSFTRSSSVPGLEPEENAQD